MFDGTVARAFAGYSFLRADTLRDERRDPHSHPVEDFLRARQSHFHRRRVSRYAIGKFGKRIDRFILAARDLSDDALRIEFLSAVKMLQAQPLALESIAGVLAMIGEASRRVLGYRPHDVQFMGALVLLRGELSEMQTGEGKTLVAAITATAMAATGASVHVISTNDYLAHRDAEEMQPLFGFFGLEAGSIQDGMEPDDRKREYRKPICYVSGKELVFDYLKDRLAGHGYQSIKVSLTRRAASPQSTAVESPIIPCLHFAIVDEADSVLIDEARTPLIISREAPGLYEPELIQWAVDQARRMREGEHYAFTSERSVELKDAALSICDPPPESVRAVWRAPRWQAVLLKQAITAVQLFSLDQHYIIAEGKVQIVDESTGRVMPDRTWEQGLHQLIECKEGLEMTGSRETLAKMTFQRFFRHYYLLSGLTGTAAEARGELWSVYRLIVRRIPPHRANLRLRLSDICARDADHKWLQVCRDTVRALAKGQPVLIGTRSVEASEAVSAALTREGVEHVVLNARQDSEEAEIVKCAGEARRVTVATNMAGRGTDIKLTPGAREAGGLHVVLTEFHESARVDRQLFGRSGRQGDRGTTRAVVAFTDNLFVQYAGLAARFGAIMDIPFASRMLVRMLVLFAQWRAERKAYRARKHTLKQDKTLHRQIGFAGRLL